MIVINWFYLLLEKICKYFYCFFLLMKFLLIYLYNAVCNSSVTIYISQYYNLSLKQVIISYYLLV